MAPLAWERGCTASSGAAVPAIDSADSLYLALTEGPNVALPAVPPVYDPVYFYPDISGSVALTDETMADIAETVQMQYFSQEGGDTRADVVDALAVFHQKLATLGKRGRDDPPLQVGLQNPALRRCSLCHEVHGGRASRERAEREQERELLTPTASDIATSEEPSVQHEHQRPL